jgi:hypothetical protein
MNVYYLIQEKHFTRSVEVLEMWEKDVFTYELANAFKGVILALQRTGKKIYLDEQNRLNCASCGASIDSKTA